MLYLRTLPVCKNVFVYLSCVCMCACLHEFMCTVCVQGPMETRRGHRIPLELELQAFMSCHGVSHVSFNQLTDVVIDLDFVVSVSTWVNLVTCPQQVSWLVCDCHSCVRELCDAAARLLFLIHTLTL